MARPRQGSTASASDASTMADQQQELGSMYDFLFKIILLGPSGAGKSCLLHRFVKDEWRVLSSQTIGVEFSSRIIKIGSGTRRKRVKLQLWDTAGTERFRSVSRSYYRGAAGALLIYDIASHASFEALPTFLMDAKALASPNLTIILAGNKRDVDGERRIDSSQGQEPPTTASSVSSRQSGFPYDAGGSLRSRGGSVNLGSNMTATMAAEGRDVTSDMASRWASKSGISVAVEVSALSGENVEDLFNRLARMILTKIELGEIDPDDPQNGIQYGDVETWEGPSTRSDGTMEDETLRRRGKRKKANNGVLGSRGEWGEVFKLTSSRRSGGCC